MPPQIESGESGSDNEGVLPQPLEDNDVDEDDFVTPESVAANGARTDDRREDKGDDGEGEEDEENDEDDDEADEVYVVERIIKHAVSENDAIIYQVKWKDYPNADNTWETEDNLDGAKDLLKLYFNKIGGRPTDETNPRDAQKKRGRKSAGTSEPASKRNKVESVALRTGRGRKPAKEEEEPEDTIKWPGVTVDSDWTPPKPRKDSWEDILLKIEALEVDEDGTKWAFVLWSIEDDEGRKRTSKVLLDSVSIAAPQATIKFYESHLVFTKSKD